MKLRKKPFMNKFEIRNIYIIFAFKNRKLSNNMKNFRIVTQQFYLRTLSLENFYLMRRNSKVVQNCANLNVLLKKLNFLKLLNLYLLKSCI